MYPCKNALRSGRATAARIHALAWGAAVAILWTARPLTAQVATATGTANIALAVVNGLTVLVDRPLDFGTVVAGVGSYPVGASSPKAGKVRVYADKGKPIIVTLTPGPSGAFLLHTDNTHTLPWTFEAAYNSNADDPASATPFVAPIPYTASIRPGVNLGGNARVAYLYLYGSVNTTGVTTTGLYQSTVTISIHY